MNELIDVKGLTCRIKLGGVMTRRELVALHPLNLSVQRGESIGIVGESGSGKTTLGRLIARLMAPTGGQIHFCGERIDQISGKALRPYRRRLQMVFQDPAASFNPRHTLKRALYEPLELHQRPTDGVGALLEELGLASELLQRFPHQLSGGQQQRMALARALALEPDCLILDEVTSALDPQLLAHLLDTLRELRHRRGVTLMLISHDLSAVAALCDRIIVLYRGYVVEEGPTQEVLTSPHHPYTQLLLASVPVKHPALRRPIQLASPAHPTDSICPFAHRCPHVTPRCHLPFDRKTVSPGHQSYCVL
jgi:peptide/nickel transport system ATP-binding protein